MKVYQMKNDNGNAWANQFIIEKHGQIVLQSYQSLVVLIDYNFERLGFGVDYDYSNTTSRAVSKFLRDELGVNWKADDKRKALENGKATIFGKTWEVFRATEKDFQ